MPAITSPPPDPDVIPVRKGEDLDCAALAAYLAGKLPGAAGVPEVWQFSGGHANLTYLLRYAAAPIGPGERAGEGIVEYVLRRPPLGDVAATAHDMGREYRVLSVLYKAFPPAPRAYLYCEDPAILGAPFFVMERRCGVVVRGTVPPQFGGGGDPVANRKLSEILIDTLVDLHRVDPATVGLETLGKPDGFLHRQVTGWTQRWERAKTGENTIADELARWLAERLPTSPPATLLHNDWRLDNMMVADDDPGRVVAVFDWDMCTLGDPLADLGTLLVSWFETDEEGGAWTPMPSQAPGFMTRREAVARYGERSGIDVSRVAYYHVFGIFKMAVVLQQLYYRYHRGQTRDERFSAFDAVVDRLLTLAHAHAEKASA